MVSNKKAIVIGAGVAGLASALRLRKAGFEVDVFEADATYGGKIKEYKNKIGYRFDSGPSLFTLPELVNELFVLCDKNPSTHFQYFTLPTVTRYFFDDGVVIDSFTNAEKFAFEAAQKVNIDPNKIISFLKKQEKSYSILAPIFIENPIHLLARLLKIKNIPALFHVSNPLLIVSLNRINKSFFKNKYITQIFNRYGTYNGSNPYTMPSLFNIISHLEHNVGAYLPKEGMRQIPNSIYQLCVNEGVKFYFNQKVEAIITEENKARGVLIGSKPYFGDEIICNMDVNLAFERLLPQIKPPKLFLVNEKSTSALIFHFSVSHSFEKLDLHNILFANNYKEEFDYLFHKKELYHDPTIYIYISKKVVENDAPAGCENWFVMINTPHLKSQNEVFDQTQKMKTIILEKIMKVLSIDLRSFIVDENVITPSDLAQHTSAYLGSLYGGSSNSILSAFVRHPNFSKVKNLHFCGGTVHPGGGVPLCLLSAKITSSLILEKYS